MVDAFEKISKCADENDFMRVKKKKRKCEREGEHLAVNTKTIFINDQDVAKSEKLTKKRKKTKIKKSESYNGEQTDSGLRNGRTACSENESKPGKICKSKKKKGQTLSSDSNSGEALSEVGPLASQSHEEHSYGLTLSMAENTANAQVVSNRNDAEKPAKKKKKKKTCEKEVDEYATILNCGETEVTHRKKKVKNNKKGKNCTVTPSNLLKADPDPKLLDKNDYQQDKNSATEGKEPGTCADLEVGVPKKKRKKNVAEDVQVQKNNESSAYDVANGTKVSENAKKCKIVKEVVNDPEYIMVGNDQIMENLPVIKKKKKRKKGKNLPTDNSSSVEKMSDVPNNTDKGILEDTKKVKKSGKKRKLSSDEADRRNGETKPCVDLSKGTTVPKEKLKKDKTSDRSSQVQTENTSSIEASEVLPKKKKRRKEELSTASEVLSKKKKRKKGEEPSTVLATDVLPMKEKKRKEEEPSNVSDVLPKKKKPKKEISSASEILPEKTTRKKELSNETDKMKNGESTKRLDQTVSAGNDNMGQWKTAKLGNSAQQDKFVRLLGGAKSAAKKDSVANGGGQSVLSRLTGVWKPPPGRKLFGSNVTKKKTFSSMALDEKEAEKLEVNLENQFNRTLEFNLQKRKEGNKAKGLGFQQDPAEGKKHYIDINKVKSIALDL